MAGGGATVFLNGGHHPAQALFVAASAEHRVVAFLRESFPHGAANAATGFQKSLGVARNVLGHRLKKLVQAGVLSKSEGPGHPEYRLTEKGLALQPIMIAMTQWGDTYLPHPDGKRLPFVDRKDGKPIKAVRIDAADGRRLKPKDIKARAEPGLRNSERFSRSVPVQGHDGTR